MTEVKRNKQILRYLLIAVSLIVGSITTLAQSLKGKVVDSRTQEPIIGAHVSIKGDKNTTAGTTTDIDGKFNINVKHYPTAIVVSYTGYNNEEIDVYEVTNDEIEISLNENFNAIENVVVIGYGKQKKANLTGAVSAVSIDNIKNVSTSSFNSALSGTIPGLQVTPTSGQPGGGVSIRVRGGSSVQGGNEPLYVIDGFPIYSDNTSAGATSGSATNPLASINPGDIASITVLKDASATAIYGSRGANGVVIVTTKKGTFNQKTKVSYEGTVGWQSLRKKYDVINAHDFAILRNEVLAVTYPNLGEYQYKSQAEIDALGNGTDWQDEAFRNAFQTNHQLSISGGSDKISYALSGGYYNQDGIIINTDYERLSGRANIFAKVSKSIDVGVNVSLSRSKANVAPSSVVSSIILMPSTATIYEADGSYTLRNPFEMEFSNPIASLKEQTNKNIKSNILATAFSEWEIIKNLKLKVQFGVNSENTKENSYVPSYIYEGSASDGIAKLGFINRYSWLNENTLTYNFGIKDNHFDVLLGFTQQQDHVEIAKTGSSNFVTDKLKSSSLESGSITLTPSSSESENSLISYLGRINYNFKEKYFISASLRADGSSRFGKDNKWGVFPSVGGSWAVSKEEFFAPVARAISNLKLRASYGVTGNQEIGNYQSLATLTSSSYFFGQKVTCFSPTRISNSKLGWESTAQFDLGIDSDFLNGRLQISADYYYKKTHDLLLSVEIPWTSGFSSSLQNFGSVSNQGFEFAVTSHNFTRKFKWDTSFNISLNRNKVLSLGNGATSYTSGNYIVEVGKPLGTFYGSVTDGILQADEIETKGTYTGLAEPVAGDQLYKDINDDGTYTTSGDRTDIGNAQPDFIFGLNNNFEYKGFDLNIQITGQVGNKLFNQNAQYLALYTGQQNAAAEAVNRYTTSNPNTNLPRAKLDPAPIFSDRFVEDGSFVRVKNLTLGYNFNKKIARSIGLSALRLYVSATNLITLTKYSGFDPEVTSSDNTVSQGTDYGIYPVARSYNFGILLNF